MADERVEWGWGGGVSGGSGMAYARRITRAFTGFRVLMCVCVCLCDM
jgi:hypothetical protein